jgi:LuxR family transcriptional regulator, maltose regulon positive regulatory protein
LLELARAYLALDDVAGASAVLGQARDVLRQRPDLGILPGQVEELWSKLDIMPRAALPGASSLSTAELRLLPLLSTHLSFREIGERRSQAIEHAQQLGLLPAS